MSRISSQEGAAPRRRTGIVGRMRRLSLLALVAAAVALVVTACGDSDSDSGGSSGDSTTAADTKPFKVGFMVFTMKNQFFPVQVEDIKKQLEAVGGELVVMDPDNDPTKQLQQAQAAINAGTVDAIMGSTIDVNAFQPALDLAADKDMPVVLIAFEPRELQRAQSNVTLDFKQWGLKGGAAVARCINERYPGRGEVSIVTLDIPGPNIKDRVDGAREAILRDAPGTEIYQQSGDTSRIKAVQLTQTMLEANPEINAAIGAGDDEVLGQLQALKAAGKDPRRLCVVGMNGLPEGLEALRKGEFYADVDLGLPKLNAASVEALMALRENPDDPRYSGRTVTVDTTRVLYE